jgi:small subunit ribosomal protein S4
LARYKDAVCRHCRREGEKLYLKGTRCNTPKCAIDRRNYPPGQHGQRRTKVTDYGTQLRAKQKAKRIFGVLEGSFRSYFEEADRQKGITGENLLIRLETRLDNVVHRLGLAASRNQARQLIRHSHYLINGKKVSIPSMQVRAGDKIEVRETSKKRKPFRLVAESGGPSHHAVPAWLESDLSNLKGSVVRMPVREDVPENIQEQLIVELYSK